MEIITSVDILLKRTTRPIPIKSDIQLKNLINVDRADAKSTTSYFLGPTFIGIIMSLSNLWKSFSGVFKRGLVLFSLYNFSKIFIYRKLPFRSMNGNNVHKRELVLWSLLSYTFWGLSYQSIWFRSVKRLAHSSEHQAW